MADPIDWTAVAAGGGTGTGDTVPVAQPQVGEQAVDAMTTEEWWAFVAKHGGLTGTLAIDPTTKTQEYAGGPTSQVPNPDPQYKYVFGDGSFVIARTIRGASVGGAQGELHGVSITNPGTAYKATASPRPTMTPPGSLDPWEPDYVVWDPNVNNFVKKTNPLFNEAAKAQHDAQLAADLAYRQRLAAGGSGTDNSLGYANLAWSRERAAQEDAMRREAAAAAYKQFVEQQAAENARNRLTNTTQFTNDLLNTWVKAAPMALLPGQTQFLGANQGGLLDRIAQMGGFTPDAAARNVQPFNIDPQVALEWARNAAAGGK